MERERRDRDYWQEQLSEYWDCSLTIQEYCEPKDLPYEIANRDLQKILERVLNGVEMEEESGI